MEMGKGSERGKYTSPEGSCTWEYLSAMFCAVGMFCIGNVVGWDSSSMNKLTVPNLRILITAEKASTLAACFSIGNSFAFPLSLFLVDRIGRRNSILASTAPIMVSWGMILVAGDVEVLMIARMIAGISMGLIMCACPIYIVEVLSANIRGSLGALGGITCYTGVLFTSNAFKQLFTIRGNLKSFLIGIILMTLQPFCGFQMILYYCHVILKDMGSGLDEYVASIIFSALQTFSATLAVLLVDRFGCKPLLLISGVITSLLLSVIATYFYLIEHMDFEVKQYSMIPLYSVFGLAIAMSMGVMGVPGRVQAEIYATDVKLLANCIVGLSGCLMAILTTKSYIRMAKSWGFGHSVPFFGFAIITLICKVILMRWLPETKAKTLLEI